jgi:diguanylate cyclase (GGDEF)-like protein
MVVDRNRAQSASAEGARQAAWLFVVVGVLGLANDVLLAGTFGDGALFAVALDALNVTIGVSARFIPWTAWHPRAVLVLPALALANLSVNIANGFLPASTQGIWLVLVFVWIGQWQPPRTSIAMGPVAATAYTLPFLFGTAVTPSAVSAVGIGVPVAVLIGETIARKERATRLAQAGQQDALALLAAANLTDDLTGLGNRRRANVLLDSLQDGDALAMLDLDLFKDVNDSLGHQTGDQVLQSLGTYLRGAVRGADGVARFGGEEFVVVLRGASESAPVTVSRLLAGWRATEPVTTLSAGVSVHRSGQSYDVTFANADAALYQAKRDGRDRLAVHAPEPLAIRENRAS